VELKGIKGDIGEMKIVLKPNAKSVKHKPCRLNPRVKVKEKKEIDKKLEVGLSFPMGEEEWVSQIVI